MRTPDTVLITADDRSGAMETAAQCADAGLRTWVRSWDGEAVVDTDAQCVVTDLRSRHVSVGESAERVRVAIASAGRPLAHKIDSTLRGNWATEVAVLAEWGGVLVVPAYPSAGRTCVAGEVLVNDVPLVESEFAADLRSAARTSRPADALRRAGVSAVVEAADAAAVGHWLTRGAPGVCVADASTDDDVRAAAEAVVGNAHVVVVGTALAVGAAVVAGYRSDLPLRPQRAALPAGDAVIVCGSRHPASRAQANAASSLPGVSAIYPREDLVADPDIVALELAVRAHDQSHAGLSSVVVLLGGDTADAFLGERAVRVVGSLGPGLAVGEVDLDGRTVTVLTKPGGFGHDQLLVGILGTKETS